MGIQITVFGKERLVAKYRRIAAELPSLIRETMNTQMVRLADHVRSSKLSGDPLNRRSGALSRSISGSATVNGRLVVGQVGSKGVPYAHVHETGGAFQIPSHERQLTMVFGKPIIPKTISVKGYTANYPQRAFLRPSLAEKQDGVISALRDRVLQVMRAA
jgi:phage gpG-like protein